jgi:hypothetical protein
MRPVRRSRVKFSACNSQFPPPRMTPPMKHSRDQAQTRQLRQRPHQAYRKMKSLAQRSQRPQRNELMKTILLPPASSYLCVLSVLCANPKAFSSGREGLGNWRDSREVVYLSDLTRNVVIFERKEKPPLLRRAAFGSCGWLRFLPAAATHLRRVTLGIQSVAD